MKFEALKPTTSPAEDETTSSVELSEAEKQDKLALIEELEGRISDVESARVVLKTTIAEAEKESKLWSEVEAKRRLLDGVLYRAKLVQRKLEGKSAELTISAEYKYKYEKGKEVVEKIELDFETEISSMIGLYEKHGIEIPVDFKEQMQVVWEENIDALKEAMTEKGFDKVLFLPENLPNLKELDKKLTEGYKAEFEKANPGKTGEETKWWIEADEIVEVERKVARLVLVHKASDLTAHPELKKSLDKKYGGEKEDGQDNKADDFIKAGEALTATEYFLLQRDIFEKTGVHIDGKSPDGNVYWTWLPGSRVGSRVVRADFSPGGGRVGVEAVDPGDSFPSIGCRPARCFFKK